MNYRKLILNRLLDKYERSSAYKGAASTNRRILINLCSDEFPEYNIEDTPTKDLINSVVMDLEREGLIGFEWMRFEKGNIISRVWLNLDALQEAYRQAERVPKRKHVENALVLVQEAKSRIASSWIRSFLEDAQAWLEQKLSIPPFLPEDSELLQNLLKVLLFIDVKGEDELLERVFSLRCFGDSKYFEKNLRRRLLSIIKKYWQEEDLQAGEWTDDEILSLIGIVKAPEQVEFCGNMLASIQGRVADFTPLIHGVAINTPTIRDMAILELPTVKRILFIENKANYVDYVFKKRNPDELVIYHGGFYSPVKGLFFKKIYEVACRCGITFYHWGDMDLGGFQIFKRLKTRIIPTLQPYLMDVDAFTSVKRFWQSFDEKYAQALQKLLYDPDYSEFHPLIKVMLKEKARVEQEAFLSYE
ncbi:hypothetical protein JOD02_002085 [Caldicoprobacter guelmensis]|uniref:Wadjet anti-phage system protein JetD domain-containing protein n=1 Tax=Caldicoprobacter guelmensis TaxID=1170224 RepID=UPI001958079D|nr:Wadjet anti-phage system protein JetD domain-containing protein [Caldicoprobacter guelmensis]MBM7583207.1 hypothetical protein [Caldicoprobacter guelmensis]